MNIGVVGSRSFSNYKYMKKILDVYCVKSSKIISGGADGADTLAIQYAKKNGIDYEEFFPEWNRYGLSAGFIRNKTIVENSDVIIAFWDGRSKGTAHTIRLAKEAEIPVYIYWKRGFPIQIKEL